MNSIIRHLLGALVIIFIAGEVVFLLVLNNTKSGQNTNIAGDNPLTGAPAPNVAGLYFTTPGFYLPTTDNRSFMLLGQLNNIKRSNNGDIMADISFATNKTQGPVIHKQFLLFTRSRFISNVYLMKTKAFTISIPTTYRKLFPLDPVKNFAATLNTLQKYEKQKAMLVFNIVIYPDAMQEAVQKSGDVLGQLTNCNRSLLNALNNNTNIPSCTPYISQITVYDTKF